tara:strand:+ start:676 stop:1641 length:966 start_codon:yes stop_codon:yes gene_type:complete
MKKKIFITGGAGTIGSSFIKNYYDNYEFISYSRNEKMQVSLKRSFSNVEIILGAVEDKISLSNAILKTKPDVIIHAAALKHVDTGEITPIQTVKSNIIGSLNVIECSLEHNIPITIGISTDKACLPEQNYGYSKLLMEKMFLEANNDRNKFSVCRFGNVTHSHGSVLPFWLRLKSNNETLKLTDSKMNRLMFSQKEAVDLVHTLLKLTDEDKGGFILSKKMKTVNMLELARVISDKVEEVGIRPGEKLDETLISVDEIPYTFIDGDFIKIDKFINPDIDNRLKDEYSSLTAEKMNIEEMIDMVAETDKNLKKSLFKYGIYG